jgi:Spy/CpxP family protein refolding chaperone
MATLPAGGAFAERDKATAAPTPAAPPSGDFRHAKEQLRQQVIDRMQTMRMWKITEELKLTEAMAAQVFPLLARMDAQERDIARERGEIFRGLREEVDAPSPNSGRINAFIERFVANRARRVALENEKVTGLRKVLSPVQQAKLVLLLPRLDEAFRHHIRETMTRGHGPGRDGSARNSR